MKVSQPRVHEIEHGELGRTTVDVLRSYIEALGGHIEVTAHVGDATYRVA